LFLQFTLDQRPLLCPAGYPGPKPDILYRMERGEEPWVCTPQSPVRWDEPDSPSPGRGGDVSCLEEPPSSWWPAAGRCRVPEEKTQTSCQGGRCVQWQLQSRRLLRKFRCLGGRSESPAEAAVKGVGSAERQEQAPATWPGKEGEVEGKQSVRASVIQSRGFPLHPVMAQQNKQADPQERLRGDPTERFQKSTPKSHRTAGEVAFLQGRGELSIEELNEAVLKDHCYCVMSEAEAWLLRRAPRPCPLREHDYCRNRRAAVSALKDHKYCHARRMRCRGRVNKMARLSGKARAVLHRLAKRKSQIGRIIRKAKQIMGRYKPCLNKRLAFPWRSCSTRCRSEPAVPPAAADDDPAKGTCGAFCSPVPAQPQRSSQGARPEALCAPAVPVEPVAAPPPSNAATEVKREATHPKVSVHHVAQRAPLSRSPDAKQSGEGRELVHSNHVSLHDAYRMALRTVDHMLDSLCQNFDLGGCSQSKEKGLITVQIDS
ncbi:hypothetical protein N338_00190, partial [Podiceps cristatus]